MRFSRTRLSSRLVADTLEAEWNEKIRQLQDAIDYHEDHRQKESEKLKWGKEGTIKTYPYNDRNGCLCEHPGVNSPLMKK
jgi:hypothetical protein